MYTKLYVEIFAIVCRPLHFAPFGFLLASAGTAMGLQPNTAKNAAGWSKWLRSWGRWADYIHKDAYKPI